MWRVKLAGGNGFLVCTDEAELAAGEGSATGIVWFHADRRTEDAAGHGAEFVNIAEAGRGIECGAWGVVGEVFERRLIGFGCAKDAG